MPRAGGGKGLEPAQGEDKPAEREEAEAAAARVTIADDTLMREPCPICAPLDTFTEASRRAIVKAFRRELPPPDRLKHLMLPRDWAGAERCWNCRGAGWVVDP